MDTPIPTLSNLHDAALHSKLQGAIDNKTKPPGSLGRLETLALQIGEILGTDTPALEHPQMVVFAADHGLTAQGISAFPADVSWQMVENFLAGGAAVSVLARQHGLALTVVDCGVNRDFLAGLPAGTPRPGLLVRKVAGAEHGTADSSQGVAMSQAHCEQAMRNGMELVRDLPGNALLLGEMGIGNTSAASLLLARLAGLDVELCTGAVLQAAAQRRVIVVDGFIASAAVLVAHALQPLVLQRCVFAHRSGERGHEFMLQHLGVQALLDMGLRLGEGSGAALAWPLLHSACAILREMASFASAGVSEKSTHVIA